MNATDQIDDGTDFTRLFREGGRPADEWAVGVEVELIGFTRDTLERIAPAQIQPLIEAFAPSILASQTENGCFIEATLGDGKITVEPGGQLEYSTTPQSSIAAIARQLNAHFSRLRSIGERLGIIFLATGFDPLRGLEEQNWYPKQRYDVMRPYLGKRGRRAWDMMCRTAAIQVNFDYRDLNDLAQKFTVATRLAPVAAAMFANSPFAEGKLSGYKSTRYAAWLETDDDRTGAAPGALDGNFSLTRFLAYVRQVPMFFIRRGNGYVDLAGFDFNRFLEAGYGGHKPILQDFTDQLTTIFTEARLKPHIEQRSMDCGGIDLMLAAAAFWKGLLYDRTALAGALEIAPSWNGEEYARVQREVARHGLEARTGTVPMIDLAKRALALAREGLMSIAPEETSYLGPLEELVEGEGVCPADRLIRNFRTHWNGDIRRAIEDLKV